MRVYKSLKFQCPQPGFFHFYINIPESINKQFKFQCPQPGFFHFYGLPWNRLILLGSEPQFCGYLTEFSENSLFSKKSCSIRSHGYQHSLISLLPLLFIIVSFRASVIPYFQFFRCRLVRDPTADSALNQFCSMPQNFKNTSLFFAALVRHPFSIYITGYKGNLCSRL